MAILTSYHESDASGCEGKTYARRGFDVAGYWTENGREARPEESEGIGIEIECGTDDECDYYDSYYDDTDDFVNNYLEPEIRKEFDKGFFKYQTDSSIDFENSVEIISQVFTRGWYNNGGREKLKYLFDSIFYKLGISQNYSCGNHINISRALFYNDRAAWLFDEEITNNFSEYCYLFGRSSYEGERIDTTFFEKRYNYERQTGHYTAINWAHWHEGAASRLEARIVGRATSGEEYVGYIDLIFNLIDKCNKLAMQEKKNIKKSFISQEILTFDSDGKCIVKEIEYRPEYAGTWVMEKTTSKRTTKQNIYRETTIYNEDGIKTSKRIDYYN